MRARASALAFALAAATAASAQDAPPPSDDPIAAILADPGAYSTDEPDEAEDAPIATREAPPSPSPGVELRGPQPASAPAPRSYAPANPPPRPTLERPVNIDELGRTPEGPPRPQDVGYDMRIRAGVASAQGKQGPLDGGWTVATSAGAGLFTLQLVDPGDPGRPLEGAWRNLQRQGLGTTGLISSLSQGMDKLVIRFLREGANSPTVLTLTQRPDGAWAGEMLDDGRVQTVVMRRN